MRLGPLILHHKGHEGHKGMLCVETCCLYFVFFVLFVVKLTGIPRADGVVAIESLAPFAALAVISTLRGVFVRQQTGVNLQFVLALSRIARFDPDWPVCPTGPSLPHRLLREAVNP